jgi:hypothetical protein
VTSPYVNFSFAVNSLLMGGNISLLVSNRGIYVQLGGGTAFGPQVAPNGSLRSPIFRGARRPSASFSVRASRSGISDGFGTTLDAGIYARNYDAHGNASKRIWSNDRCAFFQPERDLYVSIGKPEWLSMIGGVLLFSDRYID